MCGISGYISYEDDLQESFSTLKEMCKTLEKRGPDEEGFFFSKPLPNYEFAEYVSALNA